MSDRLTRVLETDTRRGTIFLAIRIGAKKAPTVMAAGKRTEELGDIQWAQEHAPAGAIMSAVPKKGEGANWTISREPPPERGPGAPWKLEPLMKRLRIEPSLLDPTPKSALEDSFLNDSGSPIDLPEDSIVDLPAIDPRRDAPKAEPAPAPAAPNGFSSSKKAKRGMYEWRGKRSGGGGIGMIACIIILDNSQKVMAAAEAAVGRNQGESDGHPGGLPWKVKKLDMMKALRSAPPFDPMNPTSGQWSQMKKDVPNLAQKGTGYTAEDLWEEADAAT